MDENSAQVVKATHPGDLALLAAHTLGFWPSESITLISLRGPRRRSGLIARLDLDDATTHPEATDLLIDALHQDRAHAVCLLVWSDQHTHDDAAALVEPLGLALLAADLPAEVATVHHRQIRQTGCDQGCCDTERPLPTDSPVAAALIGAGLAVLPTRQAVADSLTGTPVYRLALERARPASHPRWLAVAARFTARPGTVLDEQEVADLLVSAQSIDTRDRLIASTITGHVPLAMLVHLVQRAHPEHEGIHAALAMVAWLQGNAVLTEAALGRLPEHNSLGRLITQAVALHLPPMDSREHLLGNAVDLTS